MGACENFRRLALATALALLASGTGNAQTVWSVSPGRGVGPFLIGESAQAACEKFRPCRRNTPKSFDLTALGVGLIADDLGNIAVVFVGKPSELLGSEQPKLLLGRALAWGAREADVLAEFGTPSSRNTNPAATVLVYAPLGLTLSLDASGELHQMVVQTPRQATASKEADSTPGP